DLDGYSAEPDSVLLIVCDAGHGRMCIEIWGLVRFEVLREICVPDNLRAGCEILRVVARVISVVVCDDEELHGLSRYGLDLTHQSSVILVARQFAVHQNDAIAREPNQRIRSRSRDHI